MSFIGVRTEPEPMVIEDVPMLLEEAAEVEAESEGLLVEAIEEDNERQIEVEMEIIQDEQQQLQPYQLTNFYHQQ
jgi:hypothetical protein